MSIVLICVIVLALFAAAIKLRRVRRGGSLFWWRGKSGQDS
jgi:hypothetical protein